MPELSGPWLRLASQAASGEGHGLQLALRAAGGAEPRRPARAADAEQLLALRGSQGCRCSCSFPRSDAGDGPHEDMGHRQPRLAVPTRDPGDGDTPTSARPKLTIRAATLASIKSCDH
jgi:hypothetical protein